MSSLDRCEQGVTPQAKSAGNCKVPGAAEGRARGPPANQRAESVKGNESTAARGKFEIRPQRPCRAVPSAGAALEDIQALSHPGCEDML